MRAGEVVSIRLNPTDCMAVVDLVQTVGALIPNMSFPHAVSVALASALETLRLEGVIPTRDGYEYNKVMEPFSLRVGSAKKLALTNARRKYATSDDRVPSVGFSAPEVLDAAHSSAIPAAIDMQVKRDRLQVLYERKELGVVLTVEELEEFNSLMKLVYG